MKRLQLVKVILVFCVLYGQAAGAELREIGVGELLPSQNLRGLNGPSRDLSDFRGMPLVINVWASWCGPCRAEMASLERLAWMSSSSNFNIIGISTDDYPGRAQAALTESNATISHYIDVRLQLEKLLGASRLPLTVLVDAEGRVVDKIYGARAWDSADALKLITRAFRSPPNRIVKSQR